MKDDTHITKYEADSERLLSFTLHDGGKHHTIQINETIQDASGLMIAEAIEKLRLTSPRKPSNIIPFTHSVN